MENPRCGLSSDETEEWNRAPLTDSDSDEFVPHKRYARLKSYNDRFNSKIETRNMTIEDKKMSGSCSVASCKNNLIETRNAGQNISYYRFPTEKELALKWKEKCGVRDNGFNMRIARVCSVHFKSGDFESCSGGGKRILTSKAVPSLNLQAAKETKKKKKTPKSKKASKPNEKDEETPALSPSSLFDEDDIKSEPFSSDGEYANSIEIDRAVDDDVEIEPSPAKKVKLKGTKRKRSGPVKSPKFPVVSVEKLDDRLVAAANAGILKVHVTTQAKDDTRGDRRKKRQEKEETEKEDKDRPYKRRKKLSLEGTESSPVEPPKKKSRPRKMYKPPSDDSEDEDEIFLQELASPPVHDQAPEEPLREVAPPQIPPKPADVPNVVEQITCIMDSNKSEREKIIQLVEQRISEHTRIVEGNAMGPQQLADHNKILQGSALVLKKLAEKKKSQPEVQGRMDKAKVTGKTILLKKVADPFKKVDKHIGTDLSVTPDSSPPPSIPSPKPIRCDEPLLKDDPLILSQSCSPLEKIKEFDNLSKKYLGLLLDKNVMSKKLSELKDANKHLETELHEKQKELECAKKKISSLNNMINQTHAALGSFLSPNQIKLALQETKKVAWTPEEMLTAFTIKHLSKACYLFLRHKLNYPLPGISSLQRWMTTVTKGNVMEEGGDAVESNDFDEEEEVHLYRRDDEDDVEEDEGSDLLGDSSRDVIIEGTLEEINAAGAGESTDTDRGPPPYQVVFDNDPNYPSQDNRKLIIYKKVADEPVAYKARKILIREDSDLVKMQNLVNGDNNQILRLFPNAKTITMDKRKNEYSGDNVTIQEIRMRKNSPDIKEEKVNGHDTANTSGYFSLEEINTMSDQVIIDEAADGKDKKLVEIVEPIPELDGPKTELVHFVQDEGLIKGAHFFPQITIEGKIENKQHDIDCSNVNVINVSDVNVLDSDSPILKTLLFEQKRLADENVKVEDADGNSRNIVVYTMDHNISQESAKVYILNEAGEIVSNADCDPNMISILNKDHEVVEGSVPTSYTVTMDDDEHFTYKSMDHSYSLNFLQYPETKRPENEKDD